MVTLKNVKLGRKFVFRDEPGVYKKIAADRAKCVFGAQHIFGIEVGINPEVQVFIVDEPEGGTEAVLPTGAVTVFFEGGDEEILLKRAVSEYEAMVLARTDIISVKTGPRKKEAFVIGDTGFDMDERTLHLEVTSRQTIAAKE